MYSKIKYHLVFNTNKQIFSIHRVCRIIYIEYVHSYSQNREFRTTSRSTLTGIASISCCWMRCSRPAWIVLGGSVSNTFGLQKKKEKPHWTLLQARFNNRESEGASGIFPFRLAGQMCVRSLAEKGKLWCNKRYKISVTYRSELRRYCIFGGFFFYEGFLNQLCLCPNHRELSYPSKQRIRHETEAISRC